MGKKIILAMAFFIASGAIHAQSSVQVFGVLDTGVATIQSDGAGRTTGLITGGNTTSRLGFRGSEDLGGGLMANFWLEGALNTDVGGGASQTTAFDFARRSTVGLSGHFGEVRMGREFAVHYIPLYSYDVTANRGIGAVENPGVAGAGVSATVNASRVSNSISYLLPTNLGGFYGQAQYAFGEYSSSTNPVANGAGISTSAANAATDKTGNYAGVRGGYAAGPFDISGSVASWSDAIRTVGASSYAGDYKIGNIGGAYDFGFVKAFVLAQTEKIAGRSTISRYQLNTYNLGATIPAWGGQIRTQVSRYDVKNSPNDANKFSLGYIYALSKRTTLYAEGARIANKGAAVVSFGNIGGLSNAAAPSPGGNTTGFAVGIKHVF